MKAIKIVLKELNGKVPLIGFSGAPFTLASYMIEGGGSRNYEHAKAMMFAEPKAWHKLMEHLTGVIINYLNAQIDAGVQVVQLFDSWVGALGPSDYREFVLPHQKNVIAGIKKTVPLIHFAHGATHLLEMVAEAGGDVIGLDWRCDLDEAWKRVGYDKAVQGNLDPVSPLRFQGVHPEAHQGDPRPGRRQERPHHEPGPRHPAADAARPCRGVHQCDA